jgi:ribonuclease HI
MAPERVVVHFDGACQPPRGGGVAAYGFTVHGASIDHEDFGLAAPPGSPMATNNVAEYTAAIRALEYLRARGYRGPVEMLGDSQLVLRQFSGEYEVRATHLLPLRERLRVLVGAFAVVRFRWIPRSENQRADELSKQGLQAPWGRGSKPSVRGREPGP